MVNVVNFYNPCLQLNINELEEVIGAVGSPVVWVGDFNAHNPLWGSMGRDCNGVIVEEVMDRHGLLCMNDGRPTRLNIGTGGVSSTDLAIASAELARKGEWNTMDRYTIGSDHFPIYLRFGQSLLVEEDARPRPRDFSKAKWDEFAEGCSRGLVYANREGTVDEWNDSLCAMISNNVSLFIPQRKALKE